MGDPLDSLAAPLRPAVVELPVVTILQNCAHAVPSGAV